MSLASDDLEKWVTEDKPEIVTSDQKIVWHLYYLSRTAYWKIFKKKMS